MSALKFAAGLLLQCSTPLKTIKWSITATNRKSGPQGTSDHVIFCTGGTKLRHRQIQWLKLLPLFVFQWQESERFPRLLTNNNDLMSLPVVCTSVTEKWWICLFKVGGGTDTIKRLNESWENASSIQCSAVGGYFLRFPAASGTVWGKCNFKKCCYIRSIHQTQRSIFVRTGVQKQLWPAEITTNQKIFITWLLLLVKTYHKCRHSARLYYRVLCPIIAFILKDKQAFFPLHSNGKLSGFEPRH